MIFQIDIPKNDEVVEYLYKLGTYKVDDLKKEQSRLVEENKQIVEQTQDIAISNYKTFIQTSECSRAIFREYVETEKRLDCLIDKLPNFTESCDKFLTTSSNINTARRLNSLTLTRNAQLLEILEIPQLMESCIKEEKYEEALELAAYVQRLGSKHGNISVINSIIVAVESSWHSMLCQILSQLRTDLQLPKCLQIVGYLRRMQAFSNIELKLKFLQARTTWFKQILADIPKENAQQHLTKTIELTRVHLFNIITQYKAIFTEDDGKSESNGQDSNKIFHSWLLDRIDDFLQILEKDLSTGQISSFDAILGQCMYFGLSFSRVGADFRGLVVPLFIKIISQNFKNAVLKVTNQFEYDILNYTLINRANAGLKRAKAEKNENSNQPPETLLDFQPLAVYCNGILTAFNDLRLCAPIAIADLVTATIGASLEAVCRNILSFYRQEQQAFSVDERECFMRLCSCFAYDLIPYLQKCIHFIFPPVALANHLGISIRVRNIISVAVFLIFNTFFLAKKDRILSVLTFLPYRICLLETLFHV